MTDVNKQLEWTTVLGCVIHSSHFVCHRALCALALAGDEVLEGLKATLSDGGGDGGPEAALAALAKLVSAASGPAQNRGLAVLRAALR